jgi:hypothetical protein
MFRKSGSSSQRPGSKGAAGARRVVVTDDDDDDDDHAEGVAPRTQSQSLVGEGTSSSQAQTSDNSVDVAASGGGIGGLSVNAAGGGGAVVNVSAKSGSKAKSTLSFGDDEEGESVSSTSFVKKPFKKMKQQVYGLDDLSQSLAVTQPSSHLSTASFGGAYSSSDLKNLRQNQHFSIKSATDTAEIDAIDAEMNTALNRHIAFDNNGDVLSSAETTGKSVQIIELTGEDAAKYEDLPDFIPLNSVPELHGYQPDGRHSGKRKSVSFGPDNSMDVDETDKEGDVHIDDEDMRLIEQHRRANKEKRSRADKAVNRLNLSSGRDMSVEQNKSQIESFNDDDDESRRWEDALARRAGIKHSLTADKEASVFAKSGVKAIGDGDPYMSRPSDENSKINAGAIVSISQVKNAIKKSVDQLASSTKHLQQRRKYAERNVETYSADIAVVETKVANGMDALVKLQDLKLLMADLVGMLRENTSRFDEIQSAYHTTMEEIRTKNAKRRLEYQDNGLLKLEEVIYVKKIKYRCPYAEHTI